MSGLRVHHLNCAHLQAMSISGLPLACHVLLVETPADGLVLVDTGLGTADYAAISSRLGFAFAHLCRPAQDPALAAVDQVRRLGYQPEDVRHIVQTHLDLDHVGGLSDFPWAKVHVHADELQAATTREGFKARARYRPAMWAHGPDFATYAEAGGEAWYGFQAVRALIGLPDEILLIPLPGHTHGHCGIAIDTDRGWLLAAGDAIFDNRQLRANPQIARRVGLLERIVTTDKAQRLANQRRLRALAAEHSEINIFAAHDPTSFSPDIPHEDAGARIPA